MERAVTTSARSAGLLVYRRAEGVFEVMLVHPGGPYWRRKHIGAWQIPKGLIEPGEEPRAAAFREVSEELGTAFDGEADPLGEIRQVGGKYVICFAIEADLDADTIVSNMFEMEWPPGSGRFRSFPEVDAAR
jgi:predicted NUDIX family NTP pyrophosphohydrolase